MTPRPSLSATLTSAGLILVLLVGVSAEASAPAELTGLRLQFNERQVLLSFRLDDAFDETLKRRIESGLPTPLTYELELVRTRKSWFNTNVATGTLQVVAMYNAVTREYLINYKHDGDLVESRVVRDVDELRRAMTDFTDFHAFTVEGKAAKQRLRVRVRAKLGTKTVFFFIPKDVYTDWLESYRFHLPDE